MMMLLDLLGRAQVQGLATTRRTVRGIDGPEGVLDPRDEDRVHAERPQPEAEQDDGRERIGGHLAADRHVLARPARGLDDELEQAQDGGVEGLVEIGDEFVRPVHGQVVLDEVVRPDAEVIHLLDQDVGQGRGGRHLDHDPERDVPGRRGCFSAASSAWTSRKSSFTSPISSISVIIGMRMRTFFRALARRMARSWIRNSSRFWREKRIARRPRAGLGSFSI